MLKQALYSVLFLSICGSPLQIFGANPDYSSQNSSYGIFDFFYPKPTPEDLQKEIATLKSELEKLKEQQSELIAIINATKSEIVSSRDQQKRRIDDSNELERILVKYGNTTNYISVLSQAIEAGDINAVNLLLANGADVNAGKGQALSNLLRRSIRIRRIN